MYVTAVDDLNHRLPAVGLTGAVSEIVTEAPPPAPKGPTVTPFILAYSPAVVVHISPFTGAVGAVPCGITKPARVVVEAEVVVFSVTTMPFFTLKSLSAVAKVPYPLSYYSSGLDVRGLCLNDNVCRSRI